MERREKRIILTTSALGAIVILIGMIYFRETKSLATFLVVGALFIALPPAISLYAKKSRVTEVENRLPDFLRDVIGSEEAGMSISKAIISSSRNEYGALSPYVHKMAVDIDWGFPLDEVLERFADVVDSPSVRRSVSTIIQTHKSGGRMTDVMRAVSESTEIIKRLKKDREASVYSQVLQGYIVYITFLGVIVLLNKFMMPVLGGMGGDPLTKITIIDPMLYRDMIIIQSMFAGLAIGKMSEGAIIQGLKHSLLMTAIGYLTFTLVVL